ncbi:HAMP domain-containing sensor histidine kinase [Loktanella sp. SALINAS62]|uniref:sensor histidine kinase n=1 Tax=Loktanella sp. SALINAS62 TaxID=2706124 RepID=UPI001B8B972C|nr:HAMP domain-containing sensor histidine kinase [Loktanella sp. SALINAS62]MBS1303356.1 HAMP domain-containing histidine kinase [Loktanella sp. SALINAS62]
MTDLNTTWANPADWFNPVGREQRIKDYVDLANQLAWKRQASFFAAAVLSGFYFDAISIFASYGIVVLTELFDIFLTRRSKSWDGRDPVIGRLILKRIAINTVLSAVAICVFIVNIAVQQQSGGHFTPLFFLFSASVFAAMYNSQMIGILLLRLSIYGLAFVYIAFLDVLRYSPPLSSPIWLEFFTIIFVLYFIIDIAIKFYRTSQDRLEQMALLKNENQRTKAALEVKSQFLATVSHELRTPLTSIIGSLELVKSDKLGMMPATLKPIISIAARNAQRLATLIEDLLDLQKLDADEMVFQFKPLDVNDLVAEAVESSAGYASKLGIDVKTVFCAGDCRVLGDRNRLIQVMNNLLSNALKFSDVGGDAVTVRVDNLDDRIRIAVQDKGLGIPDDAQDRVFGRFSQVDSSDVRKVGGTGLGLHITKQIVARHNADIDYVSELGVGSTFYIEFDRLMDCDGIASNQSAVA